MGNKNSTTKDKHPKTPVEPGPSHSNYQTPEPLQKSIPPSSPSRHPQQSARTVDREHSLPMFSKKPVILVPVTDQSFNILHQNPPSPAVERQLMLSPSYETPLPYATSNAVSGSNLEKAPPIKLNYVVRSSDNHSLNTYRPNHITVMHRTSSQPVPPGNRWYDHDYNKNVKPLINKYL